ncbi:MAG TPA: amidohydrolase family protein, partial [Verrucomicrobiae bacterium]|nr:amidohydrolase family protein [Verrucomicrobiae bacterium]
ESPFAEPPILGMGGDFFTLRAIKLGIDGALGSRGAALFDDYSDAPGQRGLITREPSEIESIARQAITRGFQVCVHAIGDRGNAEALTALTAALAGAPKGDYRFRIEHAQVLRPVDIPRFKAAGIIPSMQPTHCTSDMRWAEARLGPKRIAGAYAWRKLLATGVPLPAGSDFPVESENPFLGLYAAVTRQDRSGFPPGGWRPDERMTIGEALKAFTLDAAYAAFEEDRAGSIEAGKRADILVLRSNPLTMPVTEILESKPAAVLVAGRTVRTSADLETRLPLDAAPGPAR